MKYTPNYGLKKPEQYDFYNVEDFNENADIIDEKLKEIEDGIENIAGEVEDELESHKNDNTRHISPNIPATAITFGGKFQIAYNSATNSLDITVVG